MNIFTPPNFAEIIDSPNYTYKCVFNEKGAIFFPITHEHRETRLPGVSYDHDGKGDALAAMMSPGKFEIRFHQHFSDQRVLNIMLKLLALPQLIANQPWAVTYQGRRINLIR